MTNYFIRFIIFLAILSIVNSSCNSSGKVKDVQPSATFLSIPDNLYPSKDLIIATHNEWTRGNYPKMIAEFKKNPLQLHDIVFLGNSITRQGGDWAQRLNRSSVKNRGIAGDVTDGVLARLDEIVYVKPEAVFLEIGINDLFGGFSPARTADNIIKITRSIHTQSPHTKIFVQTIFPTDRDSLVQKIKETNDLVRRSKHRFFELIDTHTLFADEQDKMKKIYTKDGVHLTAAGYEVWVAYLKRYFK